MPAKILILFTALLSLASAARASSEILSVSKSATLCKGANDCGYNNPSLRVDCTFQKSGAVLVSKVAIASMVGPVVPMPAQDGALTKDELAELTVVATLLTEHHADMTDPLPGRTYSFAGSQYSSLENYKLPSANGPLFVALVFSNGGQIMPSPEAARLVAIADKYCRSPL